MSRRSRLRVLGLVLVCAVVFFAFRWLGMRIVGAGSSTARAGNEASSPFRDGPVPGVRQTEAARFHEASLFLSLEAGDLTVDMDRIEEQPGPASETPDVRSYAREVVPGVLVLAWTSEARNWGPLVVALCSARDGRWVPVAVGLGQRGSPVHDMCTTLRGSLVIDGRPGDRVVRCRFDLRGADFLLGPERRIVGELQHDEGDVAHGSLVQEWARAYIRY